MDRKIEDDLSWDTFFTEKGVPFPDRVQPEPQEREAFDDGAVGVDPGEIKSGTCDSWIASLRSQ